MANISVALAALAEGAKRERVHNAQAVFKLPQDVKDLVSEVAENRGVKDAVIHREALAEYFARRGYSN
jgi:hypothetical protein